MNMKTMHGTRSLLTVLFALAIVAGGCSSSKKVTIQATQEAPKEEKVQNSDYLAKGVVLAPFIWEDGGFSETTYYPSRILTPASEETKHEYEVKAVIGDMDVSEGETKWTDDVIVESHPAKKEELKKDMIVLYTTKPADEGLEGAKWHRGVVSSTDELYKDMVLIDYVWHLDKEDEADSQKKVPVENIRIIDSPKIQKAGS